VGVLYNPTVAVARGSFFLRPIEAAAPAFALDLTTLPVLTVAEMEEAVAALAREPDAALLVPPDLSDLYRRSAGYVDRILKGAAPGELPIQAPTGFELVLNLKTAKAMGLEVPRQFLLRTNELSSSSRILHFPQLEHRPDL